MVAVRQRRKAQDLDNNPEWTAEDFKRARPFKEVFPRAHADWGRHGATVRKPGRPKAAMPKLHIGFRLAADVVEGLRASGRGYNARVEKVLREALARGKI